MTIPAAIVRECLTEALQRQIADVQLVSIPQAAELLDVTPSTARRLLGKGVDVGGKGYKVRLSDVQQLIKERTIRL